MGKAKVAGRDLRRFLKKNLPRCGPRRCGQAPRLPPAGGGPTFPHGVGGRGSGAETRGEPFPEITLLRTSTTRLTPGSAAILAASGAGERPAFPGFEHVDRAVP